MNSQAERDDFVRIVTGLEESIARFYETFAKLQPEHEEFWFGLAMEEVDHSNLVHNLGNHTRNSFSDSEIDASLSNTIKNMQEWIEKETARVKAEKPSFINSLETAITVETSMVQKGIYGFLRNRSYHSDEMINNLHSDKTSHVKYLERELEKHRSA